MQDVPRGASGLWFILFPDDGSNKLMKSPHSDSDVNPPLVTMPVRRWPGHADGFGVDGTGCHARLVSP